VELYAGDSQSQLFQQVSHNCYFITIIVARTILIHRNHFAIQPVNQAHCTYARKTIVIISKAIIIDTNQRRVNILTDFALTADSPISFNVFRARKSLIDNYRRTIPRQAACVGRVRARWRAALCSPCILPFFRHGPQLFIADTNAS
jgi:hypothetical protein